MGKSRKKSTTDDGEYEDSVKLSVRDVFSAIKLTLSISFKAGKKDLGVNIFNSIFNAIQPTAMAILSGMLINAILEAISTQDFWPIVWILAAMLGIIVITNLLTSFAMLVRFRVDLDISAYVDRAVATKFASIPLEVRESKEFADRFERVKNYSGSIRWVTDAVIRISTALIAFAVAFGAMFWVSPVLTIVVTLALIPYAILNFVQNKRQQINWRKHAVDFRKSWTINRFLVDTRQAFELQMNGLTKFFVDEMVTDKLKFRDKDYQYEKKFFGPYAALSTAENAITYGALGWVAFQIMLGKIAIGQFVTIQGLLWQLSSSARSFFQSIASIHKELVQASDFTIFMQTPETPDGTVKIPGDRPPRIEFRDVSFSYPNTSKLVLQNISFVIEPGEDVAIVGENGAGKTTIIKLLVGAYNVTSGEILIDGTPIQDISRKSYIDNLGALFQDYSKYDFATLSNNVWFGNVNKPKDEQKIRESLKRVDLDHLVDEYPKGLNQMLSKDFDSDMSAELSGGQWQRLALARGFYRNPNILILDEPTSAIDAKAEYQIFRDIMEKQADKTTVIISHRFSTVRKAERIIVLDKGKVVEQGTHAELIANHKLYFDMFTLQAEGYQN